VLKPARRRATLAAVLAMLAASCQDASLPTNLNDNPVVVPPPAADSYVSAMLCQADLRTQKVDCGPVDSGASLPEGVSADRIVGSQGLYTRMASNTVAFAAGVFSFNATVQNLMSIAMATADGATRDDAGVRVFLHSGPTVTAGVGTVTAANETGTGAFTSGGQKYWQYGGKIGGVDQGELGADGILASAEVSSAKSWQFNVTGTVTSFTFQVYISTATPAGVAVSVAPQVLSILPATLVPGSSATITGLNFNATPASNTVTIGGRAATITGGVGTTQLTVTVPCVGSGNVGVQVTQGGKMGASLAHPLQVAQRTVGLGQALVLTNASDIGCNELTATGATTKYIIAVFNNNTSPSNNSPIQISGDEGEGSPITVSSRLTAPADLTALPNALQQAVEQARISDRRHFEILETSARENERLRRAFANRPAPARVDRQQVDPALTRTFRVANVFAGNACNNYYVVQATRVYWNGKLAIYEDDATPVAFKAASNAAMQTNYNKIGDQFNADMEPVVRNNFGDILLRDASTDNDGLLIALSTPRINNHFSGVAGFVISCDQYPRNDANNPAAGGPYTGSVLDGSGNGSSNFGEVFYMYQPDVDAAGYSSGNTPDNWYRTIRSTFIHESKHVASQAARVANGAAFENSWLEEGTARHSEELWMRTAVDNVAWKANTGYGNPANNNIWCDVRPSTAACNANPRRPALLMFRHFSSLNTHLLNANARLLSPFGASPYDNASYFYAISWSLVRYAIDRYGASDAAFLTALTSSTSTGATNLAARAGVSIDQLLGGWALALAADDYPGLGAPSADIQMPTWNFRNIYSGFATDFPGSYSATYPVVPTPFSFGAFSPVNVTELQGGGVLWYEVSGTQSAAQLIRMLGNAGGSLPSSIRMAITRVQ
jgi:hypothetical protein